MAFPNYINSESAALVYQLLIFIYNTLKHYGIYSFGAPVSNETFAFRFLSRKRIHPISTPPNSASCQFLPAESFAVVLEATGDKRRPIFTEL
jgi:hypothetical protein